MRIPINKLLSCACLLSFLFWETGCKKALDINFNPNVPQLSQGNPSLIFPSAVLATTAKVGGDLAIVGGMWSQYFTQAALGEQYTDVDSYNLNANDGFVSGPASSWDVLFESGLKNYAFVQQKAIEAGDWNFYLMGTVMKVYTTTILIDLYDQIPYSEALQGAANLQPKFDDGFTIYQELLDTLNIALGKDFTLSTNTDPGTQDLVFGGNMDNWKAFANSLKLKMYLRMINSHADVATAGITALYASNPVFLTTDAAITNFTDAPGLDNPQYEQDKRNLNTPSNIKASTTFVSWLTDNGDPRIIYYYQSASPTSINQGDFGATNPNYSAAPVYRNIDHTAATDPVEFLSAAESYFLQAEADVRYFGGLNAQSLYEQGVMSAFAATGDDATTFIAPGGVYAWGNEKEGGVVLDPIAQIIRQKWASCAFGGHGIEAFFEKNRTGFPASSPVYSSDPSYVPGQLVVVKNSVLPTGMMPKRFVFPISETSVNKNAPAAVPITTPTWWGK